MRMKSFVMIISPKLICARSCQRRQPSYMRAMRKHVTTVCSVCEFPNCREKIAESCSCRRGSFFFPRIPSLRFRASLIIRHRLDSIGFSVLDNSQKKDIASHRLNVGLAVLSPIADSIR